MENPMSSHQHEEAQKPIEEYRKRLLKKEQRMLEELQEAQEKQAKALERFHRAEARLQKRTARLQGMEARLSLMHQHLNELPGVASRSILMPPTNQSTRVEEVASPPPLPTPETPATEAVQAPTPPPATPSFVYTPLEKPLQAEEPAPEAVAPVLATTDVEATLPVEVVTSAPPTAAMETTYFHEPSESAPTPDMDEADLEAMLLPTPVAREKVSGRTTSTDVAREHDLVSADPSTSAQQDLTIVPAVPSSRPPAPMEPTPITPTLSPSPAAPNISPPPSAASSSPAVWVSPSSVTSDDIVLSTSTAEVLERARAARAAAESAEENARRAAERAALAAERLEQIGSGRHLLQEVIELETEAERADELALETEHSAREAERLAAEELRRELESTLPPLDEGNGVARLAVPTIPAWAMPTEAISKEAPVAAPPIIEPSALEPSAAEPSTIEPPTDEPSLGASSAIQPSTDELSIVAPSVVEPPTDEPSLVVSSLVEPQDQGTSSLTEADDDEQLVPFSLADIAAANAAEAEALAEASSVRTREARRLALQAERALGEVRLAIRNGTLGGEEATARLQFAQRQATWAFALLADAEAAEEQAKHVATQAEAQAEVAEGLNPDDSDQEDARLAQHIAAMASSDDVQSGKSKQAMPAEFDEADTLTELPIVRPQETP